MYVTFSFKRKGKTFCLTFPQIGLDFPAVCSHVYSTQKTCDESDVMYGNYCTLVVDDITLVVHFITLVVHNTTLVDVTSH